MNSHKQFREYNPQTKRELFETRLLEMEKFKNKIKIFEPEKDYEVVNRYKDGSFGFSTASFALYSNGNNPRGKSEIAPYGLLYHDADAKAVFSISYFRKPGAVENGKTIIAGKNETEENKDGYMFIVCPKGEDVFRKVNELVEGALKDIAIPCKGAYVRFLDDSSFSFALENGFVPVLPNHAWHPLAPQEDETFSHSIVNIPTVFREKRHEIMLALNTFGNFMERNGLMFSMKKMTPEDFEIAKDTITRYFEFLKDPVGSVPEDHFGVIDPKVIANPDVIAYMGYLNNIAVSVFVGERIGPDSVGLYTPIALRDEEYVMRDLLKLNPNEIIDNLPKVIKAINRIRDKEKKKEELTKKSRVTRAEGFGGLARYVQLGYFAELLNEHEIKIVKLGGSERKDLNGNKKWYGALEDVTHWAVKTREVVT